MKKNNEIEIISEDIVNYLICEIERIVKKIENKEELNWSELFFAEFMISLKKNYKENRDGKEKEIYL